MLWFYWVVIKAFVEAPFQSQPALVSHQFAS
jgi:hypothetical protein